MAWRSQASTSSKIDLGREMEGVEVAQSDSVLLVRFSKRMLKNQRV